MAKRLYFGWREGVGKDSGKPYKQISYGQEDETWHGIRVSTSFVPAEKSIPKNLTPGQMIDIVFNEFGGIDEVNIIKE